MKLRRYLVPGILLALLWWGPALLLVVFDQRNLFGGNPLASVLCLAGVPAMGIAGTLLRPFLTMDVRILPRLDTLFPYVATGSLGFEWQYFVWCGMALGIYVAMVLIAARGRLWMIGTLSVLVVWTVFAYSHFFS